MVYGGPPASRYLPDGSTHHLQLVWWVDKRINQGPREIRGDPGWHGSVWLRQGISNDQLRRSSHAAGEEPHVVRAQITIVTSLEAKAELGDAG